MLKVEISTRTREDQTAARGVTVSTHDFLSSFHLHTIPSLFHLTYQSTRPLLPLLLSYTRETFLISLTCCVFLCAFVNQACRWVRSLSPSCTTPHPQAKSLNLLSDTSGGQNKQIGSPSSSSSFLPPAPHTHTHTNTDPTWGQAPSPSLTSRRGEGDINPLKVNEVRLWPQGWQFWPWQPMSWKNPHKLYQDQMSSRCFLSSLQHGRVLLYFTLL